MNIELLRTSALFHETCVKMWRRRDFLDQILTQRFSTDELKDMSSAQKLNACYQCDLGSEFSDTHAQHQAHKRWSLAVPALKRCKDLPPDVKAVVAYFKLLSGGGQYLSLSVELYDGWFAAGADVETVDVPDLSGLP